MSTGPRQAALSEFSAINGQWQNHSLLRGDDTTTKGHPMRHTTYCRLCPATCGLLVDVVDDRVIHVEGDPEHPLTRGFTCVKGRHIGDIHADPHRLNSSLRRTVGRGSLEPLSIDSAIEEIATRLGDIIAESGPDSVGFYSGTQAAYASLTGPFSNAWWRTIGSTKHYSSMTVDQSAKWVAEGRLGVWAAGQQRFADADVWLFAGTNPLVSMQGGSFTGFPIHDGFRRLRKLQQKGLQLIVVDPRRTELAARADLHLQLIPGTDAVLFAGLINVVLSEGLHDAPFCDAWVRGLANLVSSVSPFSPSFVAATCGLDAGDVVAAARLFGASLRGMATSGTGPDMATHANLAEHLIQTLNVVCGRFAREGDPIAGAAVLGGAKALRAEVTAPNRTWESGFRSHSGHGLLQGQLPAPTLADEIRRTGPGRLRALVVSGGNPAASIPGQEKIVDALSELDLLVTVDPFLSETARLAHYVIAPIMHLERPDTTRAYESLFDRPFAQYTPALLPRPDGLIDDWEFFVRLAWASGNALKVGGHDYLPGDTLPSTDEVLASFAGRARVPLDDVRSHPHGMIFEQLPDVLAAPPSADANARFDVAPPDVAAELGLLRASSTQGRTEGVSQRPFRLVVRRAKGSMNTVGKQIAALARPGASECFVHPDDLAAIGGASGGALTVISDHGSIGVTAVADTTIRRGVIAITHGFGGLPGDDVVSANVNLLLSMDTDRQSISAMPLMSAVPVSVTVA